MAVKIRDLLKPLVKSEVLTDLYSILELLGLTTSALQDGEPIPVVLDAVVEWAVDRVWNPVVLPALQAPFLDYSSGDWLTLVAWLVYNRPRIGAQSATVSVFVENRSTTSGIVTCAVGKMRIRNSVTGKTYTNTEAFSLAQWGGIGAYPTTTAKIVFEADEPGIVGNCAVGEIAAYPTAPVTSPSTGLYPLTNTDPGYGSEEESDANLITRCRAAVGDLSNGGPRLAYISAALDPLGAFTRRGFPYPSTWGTVPPAIYRCNVVDGGGASVNVYLASKSGAAAGSSGSVGTDVFKANAAIQLFIVPPGILCSVYPATEVACALGTVTLYVAASANVTEAEAIEAATVALEDFFSTLAIGGAKKVAGATGYVFADKIKGVLAAPAYIEDVDFTFSDLLLTSAQVAVPSYTLQANIVAQ